jgi:hypothetical protein
MKHSKRSVLALLICIAVPGFSGCAKQAQRQQGYTLTASGQASEGRVLREEVTMAVTGGSVELVTRENTQRGKLELQRRSVKDIQRLSADEIRMTVMLDAKKLGFVFEDGEWSPSGRGQLEGYSLVGRRADGKWTFSMEPRTPTSGQQEELKDLRETSWFFEDGMYPDKQVRVGETWKMPTTLPVIVGTGLYNPSGTINLKLLGVTQHDGEECARIAMDMQISGAMDNEGEEVQVELRLRGEILRSLDRRTDVAADLKGHLKFTREGPGWVSMSGPVKIVLRTRDMAGT